MEQVNSDHALYCICLQGGNTHVSTTVQLFVSSSAAFPTNKQPCSQGCQVLLAMEEAKLHAPPEPGSAYWD